ncbi:protein FAR-RED IMPAIRED RESPONSE 1-like [Silene latifolia]|uniref:protein FAR-RED IMPAIRED RESPONSE 1-like n=1 Tax=Silene latifolia TaxID=37657 RepID=UPI003D78A1E4
MKKLPDKVGPTICQNTNFLKEINSIVWDGEIDTQEFELRWKSILSSYELSDHEWLKSMFDIRSSWIPAYFRDIYLGGIMRTTSRSESKNSFFGNFTNPHLTLVEFWMRFQSAMDAQRWKYAKMFERIGLLCKHVMWVLKDRGFDDIPTEYLLDRWGKYATCHPIFNVVGTTLLADYNVELGDELLELLRAFNEKLMISVKRGKSKNKKAEIEMLIGSKIPSEASVLPPEKCKNKGSGRRITSNKEKAVQENAKPLRNVVLAVK